MLVRSTWLLVLLVLHICAPVLCAQDQPPGPTSPTPQWLEAQALLVEGDELLDEQTRTSLAATYREAAQLLKQADEQASQARELKRLQDDAPRLLATIREELAKQTSTQAPDVPPDTTLESLEQRLAQANADLEVARERTAAIHKEIEDRQSRLDSIPKEIAQLNQRLDALNEEIEGRTATPDLDQAGAAQLAKLVAERTLVARTLDSLMAERDSYDARKELLLARRDREERREREAADGASAWLKIVTDRRMVDAQRAALEASRLAQEAAQKNIPALREYAEATQKIAAARTGADGVTESIAWARAKLNEATRLSSDLQQSYQELDEMVRDLGMGRATGLALRTELQSLPDEQEVRRWLSRANALLENTELTRVLAERNLQELQDPDAAVAGLMSRVRAEGSGAPLDEARVVAEALVTARKQLLTELLVDLQSARQALLDLATYLDSESGPIAFLEYFRSYLEERIFWVRSVSGSNTPDLTDAWNALVWLFDPASWRIGLNRIVRPLARNAAPAALAIVSLLALLVARIWATRELARRAELVSRYRTDSFLHSVVALLLTFPLVAFWPWLMWLAGRALMLPGADQNEAVYVMGQGLHAGAALLVPIETVRQLIRPKGLAEAHFQWHESALRPLRRWVRIFIGPTLAFEVLSRAAGAQHNEQYAESLGRITFILGTLVLGAFLTMALFPDGPVLRKYLERNKSSIVYRIRYLLFTLVAAVPLVLATLSFLGYHRTASELHARVGDSFVLCVILAVANGMLLRWLFIAHRKLAINEARRKLAQASEGAETPAFNEDDVDVPAISAKTKLLFRNVVTITLLGGLLIIWTQALPAIRALDRIQLWPTPAFVDASEPSRPAPPVPEQNSTEAVPTSPAFGATPALPETGIGVPGDFRLTLADLATAVIIIVLTFIIFRHLPALIEILLLQRLPLDSGSRYAISTIIRYLIGIVGTVLAFSAIGLTWSKVQWLAAALTFGLAFGLQEIFANFISGIIMLVERPVRVGDTVTVEGVSGTVTRIRMRATTIMDWDRKELVIPNKTFITGKVINWTLSDTISRIVIPVGISYESDPRVAQEALLAIVRQHPKVLDEPRPVAAFRAFGDSTLNFELRFFVPSLDDMLTTTNEVHLAIIKEFADRGIDFAVPQLDLHLKHSDALDRLESLVKSMSTDDASCEPRNA